MHEIEENPEGKVYVTGKGVKLQKCIIVVAKNALHQEQNKCVYRRKILKNKENTKK